MPIQMKQVIEPLQKIHDSILTAEYKLKDVYYYQGISTIRYTNENGEQIRLEHNKFPDKEEE